MMSALGAVREMLKARPGEAPAPAVPGTGRSGELK
jgi:hypothetical protein